jgi:putative PEP-CTERM system histidine kinase
VNPAASPVLYAGCAVACLAWALLALGCGRGRGAWLPAVTCIAAAAWAASIALAPFDAFRGLSGALEVVRAALWFTLLLSAGRYIGGKRSASLLRNFALAGGLAMVLALAMLFPAVTQALTSPLLGSPAVLTRLALVLLVVLLAENLYRNADDAARWHVVLPCIALGGLAAFDVLLYAQAALSRSLSPAMADARAVLTALAMPLLVLGAVRDRRWRRNPPVSREVVFHGATLLVAGSFLLLVGAAGEALRHIGADWASAAELGLWASTAMALALASTAPSVRSRLRRYVVDHFFTARFDYRQEWLRCVATLSAPGLTAPIRAIRAIADPTDSPAGLLMLREPGESGLHWAGSWNRPEEAFSLPDDHPLVTGMRDGNWIVPVAGEAGDLQEVCGKLWLAVPLTHERDGLIGAVLLAPPRVALPLDGEVFALLRTLGREVAMFLAERRSAERLSEQQGLRDHAERFAFVAHDVKTVASQLTLLLANADDNIHDPEFQRDMLLTVRASATRINTLIARLRQPEAAATGGLEGVEPLARLQALAAQRQHPVEIDDDDRMPRRVSMPAEAFDAAVTHLLDNAAEASSPGQPVRVRIRHGERRVMVEIIDHGTGMTPEFIRDKLFRPLATMKPRGSGIGAWQARELLRRAGGDLAVSSRPGLGTTMRLTLPVLADTANSEATMSQAAPNQLHAMAVLP